MHIAVSTDANNDSQDLHPGDELPGAHRVDEELANGRLGAAYVVVNADGERRVGSVLHREHVADLGEWFLSAAVLRQGIVHTHMPRTFVTGTLPDGRPVEITELLEGESLREAVINRTVPLPLAVVARVIREVADALDDLHKRTPPIVHRALTPDNVLLTAPDGLVKLLGVGEADRPRIDAVRSAYQSPEALADIASLTPRADVFVLASLAFEALTGRHAFSGTADEVLGSLHSGARPSASALREEVPAAADAVLRRCWELSPEKRPATAGEAAKAFSAALGVVDTGEVSIPDEPTGSVAAPLRVVRRRNALLGPTVETTRPDVADPRSFLENIERTEVSTPAVPAPSPVVPRPDAAPRAENVPKTDAAPKADASPRPESATRTEGAPRTEGTPRTEGAPRAEPVAKTTSERPPPRASARSGAALRASKGAVSAPQQSAAETSSEPTDRNVDTSAARPTATLVTTPRDDAKGPRRESARTLHDTLDTSAPVESPAPVASPASPFSGDPRATLLTTLEGVGTIPSPAPEEPAPTPAQAAPTPAQAAPSPFSAPTIPTMQGLSAPPQNELDERPPVGSSTLKGIPAAQPPAEAPSPVAPASSQHAESPATMPLPHSPDTLPLPAQSYAQSPAYPNVAPLAPLPPAQAHPSPASAHPSPAQRPAPQPLPQAAPSQITHAQAQYAQAQHAQVAHAQPQLAPGPLLQSTPAPGGIPEARPITRRVPHAARAPDEVVFPDEPTGAYDLDTAKPSPWRSPWVVASIFLANAIIIVGVAHAIALAASREPMIRVVQGPAPVCAPCAACPIERAVAPTPPPAPPQQVLTQRADAPSRSAPAAPRRAGGIIREVPAFGAPRRR